MNFGFNSNVRVGEALYHVQTEDRGPTHPFLDTVVYMSGRVVYKRSVGYDLFAISENAEGLAASEFQEHAAQRRRIKHIRVEKGGDRHLRTCATISESH